MEAVGEGAICLSYLNGFLLGMTLQLSLGPVFFAVLHKAVTEGSREAIKMTLGAAIIDATYISLSFTGIALLLQIKFMQSLLLIFGSLVLIAFGLRYMGKARQKSIYIMKKSKQSWSRFQVVSVSMVQVLLTA